MGLGPDLNPKIEIVISQYCRAIFDDLDDTTKNLLDCGPAVIAMLRQGAHSIEPTARAAHQLVAAKTALRTLLALADDNINNVDFRDVNSKWLQLYTDTTILLSVVELIPNAISPPKSRSIWFEAVRKLDNAIIVTGGIGHRRLDWILDLIAEIQAKYLPNPNLIEGVNCGEPDAKRMKRSAISSDLHNSGYAALDIPVLSRAPSITEYRVRYAMSPFIVRNFFKSEEKSYCPWPALRLWNSAEYLMNTVGEGRVVPVEVGKAYVDTDWGQKIIPFRDFLHRVGFIVDPQEQPLVDEPAPDQPLYLAQHPLFLQFPQLQKDFILPDYVWSSPNVSSLSTVYTATEEPIVNVWIGKNDTNIVSPAHTDPHFNCYAQVLGNKRVWIAPPESSPFMHAYGSSEVNDDHDSSLAETYMTNTSRVPILRSGSGLKSIRGEFPDFFANVTPHAQEAVLYPGDLLSLPPGWWHAMCGEGEGPGWSVSMWF